MLVLTVEMVVALVALRAMALLVVLVALGLPEVLVAVGQPQLELTVVLGNIIRLPVQRLVIAEEALEVQGEAKAQMKAPLVLAQEKVAQITRQAQQARQILVAEVAVVAALIWGVALAVLEFWLFATKIRAQSLSAQA